MKLILKSVLFSIGIVFAAFHCRAGILAGPLTNSANGHFYYLLDQTNWTDSERQAVGLGGHLATVRSQDEENWIYNTFNSYGGVTRALWIGLHDLDETTNSTDRATRRLEFGWTSGEPVTYSHWSPVEPNNPSSEEVATPPTWEYYVHIWDSYDFYAGTWNNDTDGTIIFSYPLNGVVELVHLPVFLTIAKVGTNHVQISWPLFAASHALQRSSDLSAGSWKNVTTTPSTNGSTLSITVKSTNAALYYRLQ